MWPRRVYTWTTHAANKCVRSPRSDIADMRVHMDDIADVCVCMDDMADMRVYMDDIAYVCVYMDDARSDWLQR